MRRRTVFLAMGVVVGMAASSMVPARAVPPEANAIEDSAIAAGAASATAEPVSEPGAALLSSGAPSAVPPPLAWAAGIGSTSTDWGEEVTVDGAGNVYTTGRFAGAVDFDPGPGVFNLSSAGSSDVFVSKLDAAGNLVWAARMGGTDSDAGKGVAVDGAGNVYTTGRFVGTADFDPGPGVFDLTSAGLYDVFVSKLDAGGNLVWAARLGGTDWDRSNGVAVDGAGNVYTAGYFRGTADFDPGPGVFNLISAGGRDAFVSKLDAAGNMVWAARMGSTSTDWAEGGVAVDDAGNVYTTGYFTWTVDFDPGPGVFNLTSAGVRDVFVSKLDAAGNLVWAARMGGTSIDWAFGVAVDGPGNVYTTGGFVGTADFDPGAGVFNLTSAGGFDVFVSKLDADGNLVWATGMGGTRDDRGEGVAVNGAGNVYATGKNRSTDFDPGPGLVNLTSAGERDVFVSKLNAEGDPVWAAGMGATGDDWGFGVAVDDAGNVYTTGVFNGTVDFDPGPGMFNLTSAGADDAFVSKFGDPAPKCNGQVATLLGTDNDDILFGTPGPDVIHGLAGNDKIRGMAGDDLICGGDDDDTLYGNGGDDVLYGERGKDLLYGAGGADVLDGGGARDILRGQGGDDLLYGGLSRDLLIGGNGNDQLHGGPAADNLRGNTGNDQLYGDGGTDTLTGGPGRDDLDGGAGTDTCHSGESNTNCET